MNRIEMVREKFGLHYLQATDVVRFVSEIIGQELEAHADFLDLEGDLYSIANALRKAAVIARNYTPEENL